MNINNVQQELSNGMDKWNFLTKAQIKIGLPHWGREKPWPQKKKQGR
jgi:hypothetical protein